MKIKSLAPKLAGLVALFLTTAMSLRADLNAGLVAYYPLNGNANDASGNGNNGTTNGNVIFVPGQNGLAAQFDGSDFVAVPDANSLDLRTTFTLSAWVWLSQLQLAVLTTRS